MQEPCGKKFCECAPKAKYPQVLTRLIWMICGGIITHPHDRFFWQGCGNQTQGFGLCGNLAVSEPRCHVALQRMQSGVGERWEGLWYLKKWDFTPKLRPYNSDREDVGRWWELITDYTNTNCNLWISGPSIFRSTLCGEWFYPTMNIQKIDSDGSYGAKYCTPIDIGKLMNTLTYFDITWKERCSTAQSQ